MSSVSEVGHAKNVAHFVSLISYCTSYGTTYNPSNNAIKLAALNTLSTSAQTALTNVTNSVATNTTAINNRIVAFQNIKKLATRMLGALTASGATTQQIANAKTINRKIQGSRANITPASSGSSSHRALPTPTTPVTPTPLPTPTPTLIPTPVTPHLISVSQQSYDNLIQHLQAFIALLQTITSYNPNETDLKIAALNTYLASLNTTNTAAVSSYTNIDNTRIARNKVLYTPTTGLCAIAEEVKNYLKSVYGSSAPEYKQVNALRFRTQKL